MNKNNNKNNENKKPEINELEKLKTKNNELSREVEESVKKILELKTQIEAKQNKIHELNNKYDQLNKDFVNIINQKASEAQKQVDNEIKNFQAKYEKEIAEIKKYAVADSIPELLNIFSKFDFAVSQDVDNPKVKNFLVGLKMFSVMFKTWLKSIGVEEIEVKVGDQFDPNIMDAIDVEQKPTQKDDHVEKIVSKGYKLHDRIIQHVGVIVAKRGLLN
ncbi:MAG: nucleotide exchange factor GrpE [Mycoplasma sp.]|nr:nucleotide exchange factor GrpE [Mycoplasma sp.]